MSSCNLWVKAGLVNDTIEVIIQIVYTPRFSPPKLPELSWNLIITLALHGTNDNQSTYQFHLYNEVNRKQIHLKMAWELTIQKSQGLALTR